MRFKHKLLVIYIIVSSFLSTTGVIAIQARTKGSKVQKYVQGLVVDGWKHRVLCNGIKKWKMFCNK